MGRTSSDIKTAATGDRQDRAARAFHTAFKHFRAGLYAEAKQILLRTLELEPRNPDALFLLAWITADADSDLELAVDLARQAVAIDRSKAPYWVLLGNLYQRGNLLQESITCYRQALDLDPDSSDAFYNLGNTLVRVEDFTGAIACFEETLLRNPQHLEAHTNLGLQYRQAGRYEDALRHLETACRLDPNSAAPALNLANVYSALERHEDALREIDRALAIVPLAAAVNNRGNTLRALGRMTEAIAAFTESLAADPERVEVLVNLGVALQAQGKLAESLAVMRRVLSLAPEHPFAHSTALFTMHYDESLDSAALLAEHRKWGRRHAAGLSCFKHIPPRGAFEQRLRIGYVSPDFRQHPVAMFVAPVLAAHNREKVEVFGYHSNFREDAWTERVKAACDRWRPVGALSDRELAERIRTDGIDILIDLAGHTAGNRLLAFARKPAPVQISWLGYFNTTGLEAMDYLLVDPVLAPEPQFVERPLDSGGCYLCFAGPDYAPDVAPLPAVRTGTITFGCFNTQSKITTRTMSCWAGVLQAVPGGRLILKNSALNDTGTREFVRNEFERCGVAVERLDLRGSSPHRDLLATYAEIDIALDPFPYNGGTTTCEALWMGVPVVTLRGNSFVSRVGATILHHCGHPEWISPGPEQYPLTAAALARDLPRLESIRMKLRDDVRTSVLGNVPAFTERLEDAYRRVWRQYCSS